MKVGIWGEFIAMGAEDDIDLIMNSEKAQCL